MRLIVDANILLAGFIKASITRELLLDEQLELFAPEHLLIETLNVLKKNKSIKRKINLTDAQIEELFSVLTNNITVLPADEYSSFMKKAIITVSHKEDAPYIAIALLLEIPIWSNDPDFNEQSLVKVYTTDRLLKLLGYKLSL